MLLVLVLFVGLFEIVGLGGAGVRVVWLVRVVLLVSVVRLLRLVRVVR